jgi:DNA-binding transcriptional regulator YiaG
MADIQIIRMPDGGELVVMPKADYEALLAGSDAEDAADAALFNERMAELANGETVALPPEVSTAMLQGASLLAALRKWKGMTQQDVCSRINIGQGYLSDLESGRRAGSPATLQALAQCYQIPAAWLA